jgi:Rps23 Pro-64 3,4-dihydroxylase Tpa1-like proline 4-hydroxylase
MSNVSFFENVLKEDFCRFLLRDSLENLTSRREMWRSNLTWDSAVVRASSIVLVRAYNDLLKDSILNQLLNSKVIQHKKYVVLNYAWTKLSYIPWHNDGTHDSAVTVYLNETWHRDWGGIYLFREEETGTIRGYIPKFNSAVTNDAHTLHSTTIMSTDAETPRITLQLFSARTTDNDAAENVTDIGS